MSILVGRAREGWSSCEWDYVDLNILIRWTMQPPRTCDDQIEDQNIFRGIPPIKWLVVVVWRQHRVVCSNLQVPLIFMTLVTCFSCFVVGFEGRRIWSLFCSAQQLDTLLWCFDGCQIAGTVGECGGHYWHFLLFIWDKILSVTSHPDLIPLSDF